MYYSYGNYEAFARPKKPENLRKQNPLDGLVLTSFTCGSLFTQGWSNEV